MAFEASNPCVTQNPEETSFVWTEDAHSLYLTFLEEAFVNDLYLRHYCSPDICGCSPPLPSAISVHATTAAESPSSAPPLHPAVVSPQHLQPESQAKSKTRRRCTRSSTKGSSLKRKGKWPSQDAVSDNQQLYEPMARLHDSKFLVEQPGSSSYSEYAVPKLALESSKRSRRKDKMDGIDRLGTDQVVPSNMNRTR